MWFVTGGVLNRYDCNTFVVYQNNADDPNALSANDTQSLIEEDHGNLWIGTWVRIRRCRACRDCCCDSTRRSRC